MSKRLLVLAAAIVLSAPSFASAQNWSFDARKVGMGSPGGAQNAASSMMEQEGEYRSIVLPFGLIQVFQDINSLNPTRDEFDLVRTIEYAASPLHYTFGRNESNTGRQLVVDLRNGELSRDLNTYRGFVPANQPPAEGLANPSYGGTIKFSRGPGGGFQGLYIGAGPYLSMRSEFSVDQQLTNILGSSSNVYLPNAVIPVTNNNLGQIALAITGGYRGRFAFSSAASERDGVYVAANYNFLRGFDLESSDLSLRLDTDRNGLVTINPAVAQPLVIGRTHSSSGIGMAVDVGVGAVTGPWEVGFGVNGIGNRIEWTDVERTTFALNTLFTGDASFDESPALPVGDLRVELPVDYRGNVTYNANRWSVAADAGHGFGGNSFHGGAEYRLSGIDLRGGGFYSRELWNPTAGIGIHLGRRAALDMAVYGNTANVERKRHAALAVSLRFGR